MSKTVNYIVVGFVLLGLLGVFYFGYTLYPKFNKCPQITSDTVYVKDTVWYYIPDTIPYYIVKHDTVFYPDSIPMIVDTMAILKDYYAMHEQEREWKDSLLVVNLIDRISQNKTIDNVFTYKILRPQTVIHNEVINKTVSHYIGLGLDIPIKQIKPFIPNVELVYTAPKFYIGAGYNGGLNCPTIKGGSTILRW